MAPQQSGGDLIQTLTGVTDVMMNRPEGLEKIDRSQDGFFWSFGGVLLAGLIDMVALSLLYSGMALSQTTAFGKGFYVFGHIAIALIGYLASLLALYLLCRTPDEQRNFPTSVIVHNWAAPIVSVAFLPLILIALFFGNGSLQGPDNFLSLVSVFWIGILIFLGLRIMRISLDITMGRAAIFFIVTTLVSLVLTEGLEGLVGLSART